MAKIPTYTRQVTPSGKGSDAYLSPSVANVGADYIGKGAEAIGQAVSGLGKTLAEIDAREKALQDDKSLMSYKSTSSNLEDQLALDLKTIKDKDKREAKIKEYEEDLTRQTAKLKMSERLRGETDIRLDDWGKRARINARGEELASLQAETKAAADLGVYDDYRKGRDPEDSEAIYKRVWESINGTIGDNKDREALYNAQIDDLRLKGWKEKAKNEAVANSEAVKTNITNELNLRKEGQGVVPEFVSNSDLESIRDYAHSVYGQDIDRSKGLMEDAKEAAYSTIRKNIKAGEPIDLDAISDEVAGNPKINSEDSNAFATAVKTYFSTYNTVVSDKIVTTRSARVAFLNLKSKVLRGKVSFDEAVELYNKIPNSKEGKTIAQPDNKEFLDELFDASETSRDKVQKRIYDSFALREKSLKDAIESQPNLLGIDDYDEMMQDFANEAIIELNDAYQDGEFDKDTEILSRDAVTAKVDELKLKYVMGEEQQQNASFASEAEKADNLVDQQEATKKLITNLTKQNKLGAAKTITDEAIRLGILEEDDDGKIQGTKKKTNKAKRGFSAIKYIIDEIFH